MSNQHCMKGLDKFGKPLEQRNASYRENTDSLDSGLGEWGPCLPDDIDPSFSSYEEAAKHAKNEAKRLGRSFLVCRDGTGWVVRSTSPDPVSAKSPSQSLEQLQEKTEAEPTISQIESMVRRLISVNGAIDFYTARHILATRKNFNLTEEEFDWVNERFKIEDSKINKTFNLANATIVYANTDGQD